MLTCIFVHFKGCVSSVDMATNSTFEMSSWKKLDEEAEMQQKLAQKCKVGWPESEIRAVIQVGHCILAKLHPERGGLTRFRRSKKRVSLETCEKTDAALNPFSLAAQNKLVDCGHRRTSRLGTPA